MNILEQEDIIKGLPDAALMKEASAPSGQVPQFLVVSEIKRRSDMRKRFEKEQEPQGTVKDQIVMEAMGIAPMMPSAMTPPQPPAAPMGAPPMGGMPPQGMPPMAPPQAPKPPMPMGGMPPMPMGGIASAPQAMPPMGMAQGGIVQMSVGEQVPNLLDQPLLVGKPLQQRIDELLNMVRAGQLSYADVLDKISGIEGASSDAAVAYARAVIEGEGAGMELVGGMTAGDREAVSEAAPMRMMPKLAGGSDLYKGPMVLRAADALGLFDSYKSKPEDDRMLEPAASALAQQVADEYAVPDTNMRGIFRSPPSSEGKSSGVADLLGTGFGGADYSSPKPGTESAAPVADLLGTGFGGADYSSVLSEIDVPERDLMAINRSLPRRASGAGQGQGFLEATGLDALLQSRGSANPLGRMRKPKDDATVQGASRVQVQANGMLPEYTDYTGVFPSVAADEVAAQSPFSLEYLQRENARAAGRKAAQDTDLSTFAGKTVNEKGESTPETKLVDAVTELPRNDRSTPEMPALDFSELIKDSKQQALNNAIIQLGAGVASGDVAGGLSAAGTAAMKGTADARALDMKRRLAEYQAGREDIRRGEEVRRYDEGMKLKREQFNSDVAYRAADLTYKINAASGLDRRALLNSVNDMIKEVNDEIIRAQNLGDDLSLTELQEQLALLKKQGIKYSDDITASLARAEAFPGFEVLGTR